MPQKPIDLSGIPDLTDIPDAQPEQSIFSKGWHMLSDPLTNAPSDLAKSIGTSMTEHSLDENPLWSEIKGFGAGSLQGIGDMVSSMTSPLGLATTALGGGEYAAGKAGLPEIAAMLNTGTRVASVPFALHGGEEIVNPNNSISQRLAGIGELAGGIAGTKHSAPEMAQVAETIKKPGIMSEIKDMTNEIRGGKAPIIPDTSIEATVNNAKNADKMVQDFNTDRVSKTVPRTEVLTPDEQKMAEWYEQSGLDDLIRKSQKSSINPIDNELDSLMAQLPDASGMELRDTTEGIQNNGSSAGGSLEEINRANDMKAKGQQFVVYDRQGNERPIIGVNAQDYNVQLGETFGVKNADGSFTKYDDKGGKIPSLNTAGITPTESVVGKAEITQTPTEPSAIYIKKPNPDVIKQTMQKGYVFDSMRDDGAFKMVKSSKPLNLPILESDVAKARPTPANAARSIDIGGGGPPSNSNDTIGGSGDNHPVTQALNFPRTVMASVDFSAPLRQGLPLIHKKAFWTSFDDMFKAWGSEKAYNAIQEGIQERPLFRPRMTPNGPIRSFAEEAGLKLTDLKSLTNREERIMSSWADKVPGVRRSERAYTAFLNKLRADTFEDLITRSKVIGVNGEANLPVARALADFVNTASGRGSLKMGPINLEKSASTLNNALFSPRLIASRVKMLNPATYIMTNPIARKEYMKSILSVIAVGNTLNQLGKMAGGTVDYNPTSSDFGKIKFGNVRLDPWAGFQQYVVLAARELMGKSTSSTSGRESDLNNPRTPFDPTRLGIAARFGQGKLNPVWGFATALLNGQKEMTGQKMNFETMNPMDNAVSQRFIPMVMQDIYQISQEDPTLLPALGPAAILGMGTQTYGRGGQ